MRESGVHIFVTHTHARVPHPWDVNDGLALTYLSSVTHGAQALGELVAKIGAAGIGERKARSGGGGGSLMGGMGRGMGMGMGLGMGGFRMGGGGGGGASRRAGHGSREALECLLTHTRTWARACGHSNARLCAVRFHSCTRGGSNGGAIVRRGSYSKLLRCVNGSCDRRPGAGCGTGWAGLCSEWCAAPLTQAPLACGREGPGRALAGLGWVLRLVDASPPFHPCCTPQAAGHGQACGVRYTLYIAPAAVRCDGAQKRLLLVLVTSVPTARRTRVLPATHRSDVTERSHSQHTLQVHSCTSRHVPSARRRGMLEMYVCVRDGCAATP